MYIYLHLKLKNIKKLKKDLNKRLVDLKIRKIKEIFSASDEVEKFLLELYLIRFYMSRIHIFITVDAHDKPNQCIAKNHVASSH